MPPLASAGGAEDEGPNCVACGGLAHAPHDVVGRKSAKPCLPPRCLKRRVCLRCFCLCCFCFWVSLRDSKHPLLRLHNLVRRKVFAFRGIPFYVVRFSFLFLAESSNE